MLVEEGFFIAKAVRIFSGNGGLHPPFFYSLPGLRDRLATIGGSKMSRLAWKTGYIFRMNGYPRFMPEKKVSACRD
jgi:hypothetical protein